MPLWKLDAPRAKNDKLLNSRWTSKAPAGGNKLKNVITLRKLKKQKCVWKQLQSKCFAKHWKKLQNKLLGFSSFCIQLSNQNPAENCMRIGLADSTSASAPNLGPFQPPSRAAELIPYTEALQRRIIHTHNWFGSLILKESERKLNIYWKKKMKPKRATQPETCLLHRWIPFMA